MLHWAGPSTSDLQRNAYGLLWLCIHGGKQAPVSPALASDCLYGSDSSGPALRSTGTKSTAWKFLAPLEQDWLNPHKRGAIHRKEEPMPSYPRDAFRESSLESRCPLRNRFLRPHTGPLKQWHQRHGLCAQLDLRGCIVQRDPLS